MKLPERRIQWICLAIAAYCAWGIFDVLYTYGFSQPKALAGCVIGTLAFGLCGIAPPPTKKESDLADSTSLEKKEPIQPPQTTTGSSAPDRV